MNKTAQRWIAAILSVFALAALGAILYLSFVFPGTESLWKEQARVLSDAERLVVKLSRFCSAYGLFLIPVLLAGTVGCGIWARLAKDTDEQRPPSP